MGKPWRLISQFVEINSPWLRMVGEKYEDDKGNLIDYWRVEKEDSLIVVTRYQNLLVFPPPSFRVGINQITLDFPGGRVNKEKTLEENAYLILKRELNLDKENVKKLTPINENPWYVNSSFNNQKLWGFYGEINPQISLESLLVGATYSLQPSDLDLLWQRLNCLQCRALLLECFNKKLVAIS